MWGLSFSEQPSRPSRGFEADKQGIFSVIIDNRVTKISIDSYLAQDLLVYGTLSQKLFVGPTAYDGQGKHHPFLRSLPTFFHAHYVPKLEACPSAHLYRKLLWYRNTRRVFTPFALKKISIESDGLGDFNISSYLKKLDWNKLTKATKWNYVIA